MSPADITVEQITDINYTRSRLFDMLTEQGHGEDCALRCFVTNCRGGHACHVCAEINDRPSGWSQRAK